MYLSLIATADSVRASLVAYIVPVVGVLLGWMVLGERFGIGAAAGTTMIACGMVLVTHGPQVGAYLRHGYERHTPRFPRVMVLRWVKLHHSSGWRSGSMARDALGLARGSPSAGRLPERRRRLLRHGYQTVDFDVFVRGEDAHGADGVAEGVAEEDEAARIVGL